MAKKNKDTKRTQIGSPAYEKTKQEAKKSAAKSHADSVRAESLKKMSDEKNPKRPTGNRVEIADMKDYKKDVAKAKAGATKDKADAARAKTLSEMSKKKEMDKIKAGNWANGNDKAAEMRERGLNSISFKADDNLVRTFRDNDGKPGGDFSIENRYIGERGRGPGYKEAPASDGPKAAARNKFKNDLKRAFDWDD